jgi:hypothetical protein
MISSSEKPLVAGATPDRRGARHPVGRTYGHSHAQENASAVSFLPAEASCRKDARRKQ